MTNRPIPRRGLLGCWFLDDRGITYDSGANEAIDRSGRGNHATYQNGVTVGTAGDPSRDFGAADFDASSNQFADVGDPLAVDGPQAITAIFKPTALDDGSKHMIAANESFPKGDGDGIRLLTDGFGNVRVDFGNGTDATTLFYGASLITNGKYASVTFSFFNNQATLYLNNNLSSVETVTGHKVGINNLQIGADSNGGRTFSGEIAAVGRYDLTVPNAPEPSEIAERWDRLTDIPATR